MSEDDKSAADGVVKVEANDNEPQLIGTMIRSVNVKPAASNENEFWPDRRGEYRRRYGKFFD